MDRLAPIFTFIIEHWVPLSIGGLPVTYLILRDILGYIRKKRAIRAVESEIQVHNTTIDTYISILNENQKQLKTVFNDISKLHAKIKQSPPVNDRSSPPSSESSDLPRGSDSGSP